MSDDQNPPKSKDYQVGYGRPPKETQFKPGQSGNPKGRKKKPKSIQDQMHRALARKVTVTEDGEQKRVSLQEVMLRSLANKAAKGELGAAKFVTSILSSQEYAEREHLVGTELSEDDRAIVDEFLKEHEELFGEKVPEATRSDTEPEPMEAPLDQSVPPQEQEAPSPSPDPAADPDPQPHPKDPSQ